MQAKVSKKGFPASKEDQLGNLTP